MRREPLVRTMRKTTTAAVAVVLVGSFAFALLNAPRPKVPPAPAFQLTAGSGFTITGVIGATRTGNTCSGSPAVLAPGIIRCVLYTVSNPLDVPITVTSITGTAESFTPKHTNPNLPACKPTEVKVTAFSGSLAIGAKSSTTLVEPVVLVTLRTTQDNCEGGSFTLAFRGTATFSDGTTTALTASPSPVTEGTPATFTAAVTPDNPTYDHTTKPHGKVTLYHCTSATTCKTPTTAVTATISGTTGKATFSDSLLPQGTLYFEAAYQGTGTDFTGSASTIVTLTVLAPVSSCAAAPTTKATKVITGTYDGTLVVPPFHSVWLDGGTITGGVQVAFLGSFAAAKGTVDGDLDSAGVVSLQGATVRGSVNAAGALGVGGSATIDGSLNAILALALCVNGASVTGDVNVHGLPVFLSLAKLCNMSVTGNITYSGNAAPLELGGSGCSGDTIKGSLTVQHNGKVTGDTDTVKGSVTVSYNDTATVAHNTVTGNLGVEYNRGVVTLADNTVKGNIIVAHDGGGALTANRATGVCSLATDFPPVTGKTNTVPAPHSNTCNRRA